MASVSPPSVIGHCEPTGFYSPAPHLGWLEEGYALPIETQSNTTLLVFHNVDDHIDGNGLAILWMLHGAGTFFYDGSPISFQRGDILMFDDRMEHGFETSEPCMAVNFDIGPKPLNTDDIHRLLKAFEDRRSPTYPIESNLAMG